MIWAGLAFLLSEIRPMQAGMVQGREGKWAWLGGAAARCRRRCAAACCNTWACLPQVCSGHTLQFLHTSKSSAPDLKIQWPEKQGIGTW